jgi:hypothetical protein
MAAIAHRDGRRSGGQPSVSGHCGLEAIFGVRRSAASVYYSRNRFPANAAIWFAPGDSWGVAMNAYAGDTKCCAFCHKQLPILNGELRPWRSSNGQFFCNEFCADDAEEARFGKRSLTQEFGGTTPGPSA